MPLESLALIGWVGGHSPFTGSTHAAVWVSRATGGSVDHGSWSGSRARAARRDRATTKPSVTNAARIRRRRMTLHCGPPLDGFRGACEHAEVMRPTSILLLM